MSKKSRGRRPSARAEPKQQGKTVMLVSGADWKDLACSGYTTLAHNPEIRAGVDAVAKLIGSMTIHLMENTDNGDVRVKNELARKVDINPNKNMTRSAWVQWIVRTMMLDGQGNAVVYPDTRRGILRDLVPIPPSLVTFTPDGFFDYSIVVDGREYDPEDVLHFVLNPGSFYPWKGEGFGVALSEVANNLRQAAKTERGFMASEYKPSLIVKVDAMTEELATPEGRAKIAGDYLKTGNAGEPWIIPADQLDVQQVKPLTLSDLALSDMVTLDKRTVASILGVPAFLLGVGEFRRDEWNNFISSTIMPLAKSIEQELTRKLLLSPDWYFRFNPRSLYSYDQKDTEAMAQDMYSHGLMTGNEARDMVGLSPLPGLDDLVILENYIPSDRIGDQSKLQGGENE